MNGDESSDDNPRIRYYITFLKEISDESPNDVNIGAAPVFDDLK